MYLKHALIENVGPIERLDLSLPFDNGRPLPVVFVGPNGSGKTTLLSFIVNALIAFKQRVFVNAEVEVGKVFRLRSPIHRRAGAFFHHTLLQFDGDFSVEEWNLDRPREQFEREVTPLPLSDGWKQIPGHEISQFKTVPAGNNPLFGRQPNPGLQKAFDDNVVLFFPSDRFEPPDWLNQGSLSTKLDFPVSTDFEGETPRRIFARSLLKPTLEWVRALAFDHILTERVPIMVTLRFDLWYFFECLRRG